MKKFKPVTPSQRHTVLLYKKDLQKNSIKTKKLIKGFKRSSGRNNQGKITIKHRGGGQKRLYRFISFDRRKIKKAKIESIEYDPNRSSNIALIKDDFNNFYYILAPEGLKKNFIVESGENVSINIGNSLPLKNIPLGSFIHNISLKSNKGGQFLRSAGTFGQLIQKGEKYANVRLQSGEQRLFLLDCFATIGVVSNSNHKNKKLGKAGRNRWLNKRPHVRGVAMNPVDHPHGGGEGKTSGGRPSVTPKGKITKGKPTRKYLNKLRVLIKKH